MRVNSSPRSSSARAIRVGVQRQPEADVLGQRRLDLVDDRLEGARERRRRAAPRSTRRRRRSPARRPRRRSRAPRASPARASSTAVTSGSTGSPPRSRLQAIRSPRDVAARASAANGPSWIDSGSRGSGPASAWKQQRDVVRRARDRPEDRQRVPRVAGAVRRESARARAAGPTRLQNAAGLRTLAPRSDPSANGSIPRRDRGRRAAARAARRLASGPTGCAWRRRPR